MVWVRYLILFGQLEPQGSLMQLPQTASQRTFRICVALAASDVASARGMLVPVGSYLFPV